MTSVLIVEDQRMPRENMEHLVEDSGRYRRVASLSTAEMALAQCARHSVDLVLMDVCTKGSRDGIDVAALTWRQRSRPGTRRPKSSSLLPWWRKAT